MEERIGKNEKLIIIIFCIIFSFGLLIPISSLQINLNFGKDFFDPPLQTSEILLKQIIIICLLLISSVFICIPYFLFRKSITSSFLKCIMQMVIIFYLIIIWNITIDFGNFW